MAQRLSDRLANIARAAVRSEATRLQNMIVETVEATADRSRQFAAWIWADLPPTSLIIPSVKQMFAAFQPQECRSNHSKQRGLNIEPCQHRSVCARGPLTNINVMFNSLLCSFSSLSKIFACRLYAS